MIAKRVLLQISIHINQQSEHKGYVRRSEVLTSVSVYSTDLAKTGYSWLIKLYHQRGTAY